MFERCTDWVAKELVEIGIVDLMAHSNVEGLDFVKIVELDNFFKSIVGEVGRLNLNCLKLSELLITEECGDALTRQVLAETHR